MLVPLRTLPGWPAVDAPSPLMAFAVILGLPIATVVLVWVLGQVTALIRRGRGEEPALDHPLSIYGLADVDAYQEVLSRSTRERRALER